MSDRFGDGQSPLARQAEAARLSGGAGILGDSDLTAMHRERAATLLADAQRLRAGGVALEPFLEIGAGSGQRSIALANNGAANGVATDISLGSLRDAPYVLTLLGYRRLPFRLCCDAQHLPFLPHTFQFVFAYQMLHRFADPAPVVAECYRVLGRHGCFFFDEEPMDTAALRWLRRGRVAALPPTRGQRLAGRLGLSRVFWEHPETAADRARGMTVARFDLATWRRALSPFPEISLTVNNHLKIRTDLRHGALGAFLASVVGGNVRGLCRKTTGEPAIGDPQARLICLDCGAAQLDPEAAQLRCRSCQRVYPVIDGILRMLPARLERELHG
jgi:SAM-dependent methyltransferase